MNNDNFIAKVLQVEETPICEECNKETVLVEVESCSDSRIKKNQKVQLCTYCALVSI